ncbi:sensor histidine kinase [Poseidonocella sp. HB161398]|uniref:sensor histidine kinase n=1 Tax=Poseidonocella sp. HB161398 TaxID=2320855 RepID=UPI0014868522|nr:ATP-binding protein [Poseidonocella sp. HB161398]
MSRDTAQDMRPGPGRTEGRTGGPLALLAGAAAALRARGLPEGRMPRAAGTVALMAAIFAVDTFTSLQGAVATLYLLALIYRTGGEDGDIRPWAAAALVLSVASHLVVYEGHAPSDSLLRLAVSGAAIIAGSILIRKAQAGVAAVRASEARYRTTFDAIAVPVCEYDFVPLLAIPPKPPVLVQANRSALAAFADPGARDPLLPLRRFPLGTEEQLARCREMMVRGGRFEQDMRIRGRSGEWRDVLVSFSLEPGVPRDRVPCTIADMTEKRRLDRALADGRLELERAHRALMLGQISASVSHELNQPLAAIRSLASAARRWLARDPVDLEEARAAVGSLDAAVERATEIVARVRAVTGGTRFVREEMAVSELVDASAAILEPELERQGIALEITRKACSTRIRGDAVLLQQVLVNLVFNAAQAIAGAQKGHRVRIALHNGPPGRLRIEVSDDGPGFPPGLAEHATEPFWTTRAEGMGIGLSVCRIIAEAHDGALILGNAPGGGARAVLDLPL